MKNKDKHIMNGNIICSIEGNIGSGKTTLIDYLSTKRYNKPIIFIREPVDEWGTFKDCNGKTVLERFYSEREKFAFSFQMMAYISRLEKIKHAVENNINTIIVTERSLYTDKNVFEKMLYADGSINDIEHQIYQRWFETFNEYAKLEKLIYVGTNPETAFQRVQKRARIGEMCVPLEYLRVCDEYHQEWVYNFEQPTLILDGNIENKKDNKQLEYLVDTIATFLNIQVKHKEESEKLPPPIDAVCWLTAC